MKTLSKFIKKDLSFVEMRAESLGLQHKEDWNQEVYAYKIILRGNGYIYSFDYFRGTGLSSDINTKEFRRDFLACMIQDAISVLLCYDCEFEMWADDYGYNPDSRKDYQLWQKCLDYAKKLAKIIGIDTLAKASETENDI